MEVTPLKLSNTGSLGLSFFSWVVWLGQLSSFYRHVNLFYFPFSSFSFFDLCVTKHVLLVNCELQSITLKRYPAELSLSSLVCLSGVVQASVVAIVATRHAGLGAWALGWDFRLYGPLYTVSTDPLIFVYWAQNIILSLRFSKEGNKITGNCYLWNYVLCARVGIAKQRPSIFNCL